MAETRTVDPATGPITLAEAKEYLRVSHTFDDTAINDLITAVAEQLEIRVSRRFVTQTWAQKFDSFPAVIRPNYSPVSSVTSITYIDENGTVQTLASSVYDADLVSEPARIREAIDQSWPTTRDVDNAVTLTYVAGYGAESTVPKNIKLAVKMLVNHYYMQRDVVALGTIATRIPEHVDAVISAFDVGVYS